MLDREVVFGTLFQLWLLQFVFFFIDIFTLINIDAYFPLFVYSLIVNLIFGVGVVLVRFGKVRRLLLFSFSLIFLFVGFVLGGWFWFLNSFFLFVFLILNRFRRKILGIEVKYLFSLFIFVYEVAKIFLKKLKVKRINIKWIINILLICVIPLGLVENKYYLVAVLAALVGALFVFLSKKEPYLIISKSTNTDRT